MPNFVVRISGLKPSADPKKPVLFNGTGFLVSPQGHVATCWHVIENALEINAHLPYTEPWLYTVLAHSKSHDLALLSLVSKAAVATPHAALNPVWRDDVNVGDPVSFWGCSAASSYTAPQCFECSVSGFAEQYGRIGLNGDINSGDSGAPVLDAAGKVIGIAQAKDVQRAGQGMAIPVSLLIRLLDDAKLPSAVRGKPGIKPVREPSREQPFVGREGTLRELKRDLLDKLEHQSGANELEDYQVLLLLPGVGKTELATVVANDPEILQHFSDGVLWADLGRVTDFVPQLKAWAKALGMDKSELAETKPGKDWQTSVKDLIGDLRMLLILDDVWKAEDARFFSSLGKCCVCLVTTRLPVVAYKLSGKKTRVEELDNVCGMQLLERIAPQALQSEENRTAAIELVQASGGLPLTLVLLGNYLKVKAGSGDPLELRLALAAMNDATQRLQLKGAPRELGGTPVSLETAIDISYEALDNDEARRTLRTLSIFRPKPHAFTVEIAQILGAKLDTIFELEESGFLEYDPKSDPKNSAYKMHRTITEYARDKLPMETSRQLHLQAYDYYRARCAKSEENPSYGSWYRYEEAQWCVLNDHRLYHLAHSGDEAATMLEFVRTFFDAFWWWGCFLDFSLCDELVAEWRQKEISIEAREGIGALRVFQKSYPKETEDRRAGNWVEVEAALRSLLEIIKLDGDTAKLAGNEQRHVRGLIDIFLAEAYRFGQVNTGKAASLYQEAHDLFQKNNDDWVRAWILYHFADMNYDRGEFESALRQCAEAIALGEAQEDPEVIAQAYRTRGDAYLARGEIDQAADNYAHATYHAFRFQAHPEPPDKYTIKFYSLIVERVLEAIWRLHDSDPAQAITLCDALHRFWAPYWKATGAGAAPPDIAALLRERGNTELAQHILPTCLDAKDFDALRTDHGERVLRVVGEMQLESSDDRNPSRRDARL